MQQRFRYREIYTWIADCMALLVAIMPFFLLGGCDQSAENLSEEHYVSPDGINTGLSIVLPKIKTVADLNNAIEANGDLLKKKNGSRRNSTYAVCPAWQSATGQSGY